MTSTNPHRFTYSAHPGAPRGIRATRTQDLRRACSDLARTGRTLRQTIRRMNEQERQAYLARIMVEEERGSFMDEIQYPEEPTR